MGATEGCYTIAYSFEKRLVKSRLPKCSQLIAKPYWVTQCKIYE